MTKLSDRTAAALKTLTACALRTSLDAEAAGTSRKVLVELAQHFAVYEGHSRDSQADLAALVADAVWDASHGATAKPAPSNVVQLHGPSAEQAQAELAEAVRKAAEKLPRAKAEPEFKAGMTAEQLRDAQKAAKPASRKPAAEGTRAPKAAHRGRYPEALKAKAAAKNKRGGKGLPISEPSLAEYITGVLAADPEAVCSQELEVAYWLENLALSRGRWNAAWQAVAAPTAAKEVVPNAS